MFNNQTPNTPNGITFDQLERMTDLLESQQETLRHLTQTLAQALNLIEYLQSQPQNPPPDIPILAYYGVAN